MELSGIRKWDSKAEQCIKDFKILCVLDRWFVEPAFKLDPGSGLLELFMIGVANFLFPLPFFASICPYACLVLTQVGYVCVLCGRDRDGIIGQIQSRGW